tara:strand:+ start:1681 stop:2022 length:342 start_codon:yes stop_codon:yes gene_type:complete
MIKYLIIPFLIALSCASVQNNKTHKSEKYRNERELFNKKVNALHFLNDYHHQMHFMIGEEEGSFIKAYNEFNEGLSSLDNDELFPVEISFQKIKNNKFISDPVIKLDYLIDYD